MPTPQYNFYKHRKARQDVSSFAALIATPVVGPVSLPAGARIGFMSPTPRVEGTTAGTMVGPSNRTIQTPTLLAGQRVVIDRAERATVVEPAAGFELQIDTGLGVWRTISTGAV
jgi:hypothetical protein